MKFDRINKKQDIDRRNNKLNNINDLFKLHHQIISEIDKINFLKLQFLNEKILNVNIIYHFDLYDSFNNHTLTLLDRKKRFYNIYMDLPNYLNDLVWKYTKYDEVLHDIKIIESYLFCKKLNNELKIKNNKTVCLKL